MENHCPVLLVTIMEILIQWFHTQWQEKFTHFIRRSVSTRLLSLLSSEFSSRTLTVESTNELKKLTSNDESLFKFTTYTGLQHSSCDEEMNDADLFISRCLNLAKDKTEL